MKNSKNDLGIVMLEAICAMSRSELVGYIDKLCVNHLISEEEEKHLKALLLD